MSLLTADLYRRYVYILDEHKLDAWWWLATPWSTPKHGYSATVKCVAPSGNFYGNDCINCNGKTQIFPIKNGVNYLGFHTYITDTGKVIRKLKNQNKRNKQKKYLRMAHLVAEGMLPLEKFYTSYNAWRNHISHGDCHNLGRAVDKKIREVFRKE